MEDAPHVSGRLVSGRACITDESMVRELESRGYGEMEKGGMFLKQFEALYLLYTGRLSLGGKGASFESFLRRCQEDDPGILAKFLIYRDLRNRGYVVKDGFGFGSDFRVYERGHFGQKGAKFLVFGLEEGQKERMGSLQKKVVEIVQMGKEPIIAVIERRGEVIYYKINRMAFGQNASA